MALIRWNPYRGLVSLPLDVENFFERFGLGVTGDCVWNPSVDVEETEEGYEVKAELPGMKKEDIHILLEDGVLVLKGEKKQESETKKKNFHKIERSYGRFERSFRLPDNAKSDGIRAKVDNGVLSIFIPKSEEAKPKEIQVAVE
jgi:HSP20 family protein